MKKHIPFFLYCFLPIIFLSCDKAELGNEELMRFGFKDYSPGEGLRIIEGAYLDAFRTHKLTFSYGSHTFVKGTSKKVMLEACRDAEIGILTSDVKFSARYVWQVWTKNEVIYTQTYGVNQ